MFRRSDWISVDLAVLPVLTCEPSELMKEDNRYVGIIASLLGEIAEIHLIDNQYGHTMGMINVPVSMLQFIKSRTAVPPFRLATYEQDWIPRGVRSGLVN